jgi:hypothetical protein
MMAQASPDLSAGTAAPAGLRQRRFRLSAGTPTAAHAVTAVRAVIEEWRVPVNPGLAGILASDLVINAAVNGAGEPLTLSVQCTGAQFRVEVRDASVHGDSWETPASGADAQRGLLLAAALAAESGHYRTPAGRAVFYVLAFPPSDAATGGGQSRGGPRGDGEP